MNRLVSIKISHYNEQARWALDFAGIPFIEHGYMPILHGPAVAIAVGFSGKGDRVSTRFSTPVLTRKGQPPLTDSREIMRFAHGELAAREQGPGLGFDDLAVQQWVDHFHDKLGPHTRRAGYGFGLQELSVLRRLGWANVGPWQARLFAVVAPIGRALIRRSLGVTPEGAAKSADKVREQFRHVGKHLATREFLEGGRFSAADISFASLAAPSLLVQPEEGYGAVFPRLDEGPPAARAFAEELRAMPAGIFAMRMFREYRRRR